MNRFFKFISLAVCAAGVSAGASHATTFNFSGDTSGFFYSNGGVGGFDPSSGSIYFVGDRDAVGGSTVGWGGAGDDPSTLGILDTSFNRTLVTGRNEIEVARMEWFNATWTGFDDIFTLYGKLEFGALLSSDAGDQTFQGEQRFGLEIITTDNNVGASGASEADEARLSLCTSGWVCTPAGGAFTDILLADGLTLTDIIVSVRTVTEPGGFLAENGNWVTTELGRSQLVFSAVIENEHLAPVPLPAAGWLLLAGIGGLVAIKRRSQART
ncbi:VPLPA-CTERM sorting domain-containing protein [Roseibacterium sp. SDUM158017]|uniref:VPLPA-CTERM sorting domain-containing protein n=1 Tax=Roseicyclus salinarum TaxID=3036773 RepID=UPI0024153C00|nr:VPLPA-CTERM sorting domain-containing protein [Roseibacterium sp. SDUM158017]MDG4648695.1 VPLPA-CTERM sorting domain-containing protein [Roseibacterium sp. SDUM158017]